MNHQADIDAPALEIRSRLATLFTLRPTQPDADAILAAVDGHMARAPAMFSGMPVALDLDAFDRLPSVELLGRVVAGLRQRKLAPTALRASDGAAAALADELGLALLAPHGEEAAAQAGRTVSAPPTGREAAPTTRFVSGPVRSGQQVYARGGDLVILASVGAGAEVLADGCVHVYGVLNGRAGAGVQGNDSARIFCQQFNAELVSIAGCYQVGDEFSGQQRGRSAQIRLEGETLVIEPLENG